MVTKAETPDITLKSYILEYFSDSAIAPPNIILDDDIPDAFQASLILSDALRKLNSWTMRYDYHREIVSDILFHSRITHYVLDEIRNEFSLEARPESSENDNATLQVLILCSPTRNSIRVKSVSFLDWPTTLNIKVLRKILNAKKP